MWMRRYEDHIAPLNKLVDELRDEGNVPYIAPIYGGVNARLLSVLRDPGPKTQLEDGGSGFLYLGNNDATAKRMRELISEAGIDATDMVPWNAYPWYINRAPKALELNAGVTPLRRIIDLLPELQVVVLHGGSAHASWKKIKKQFPDWYTTTIENRKIQVIETYHTSRQAFWHPDLAVREARKRHLQSSLHEAALILRRM